MSKLLDLARGGETFVFDSSEDNRKVLVPLPQVLKTWKEMTGNEVIGSKSSKTQLSSGQSGGQSELRKDTGVVPSSVQTHSSGAGDTDRASGVAGKCTTGPNQGGRETVREASPPNPSSPILHSMPGLS